MGRVLEQNGKFVGPAGDGQAQGLGQNNAADAREIIHAQGARRLELPLGQTFDGPAENLGLISRTGTAEHQAADQKGIGRQAQADEQAVAEKKQHQNGHAPEKPDVQRHQPTQPRPP